MDKKKSPLRWVWITLGFICLVLGTIGVVLPILPTVPFYMATLLCFTKSSEKLRVWFIGTKLYKKHLENFVTDKAMTMKTKLSILGMVSVLMGVGFAMMKSVPVARGILVAVWVGHVLYFLLRIKTIPEEKVPEDKRA